MIVCHTKGGESLNVKQLGRRLLQIVIVLLGISFFTFILTYLAPGDPVRTRYAASGMIPTEQELNEEREKLGLNDPIVVQYGRFKWEASGRAFISQTIADIKAGFFSIDSYVACFYSIWNVIGSV